MIHIGRHSLLLRTWILSAAGILLAVAAIRSNAHASSDGAELTEYQIKAGFLYHFAKYVEWPERYLPEKRDKLVFGVLGRDPFGEILEQTLIGKTVGGRSLEIIRFESIDDLTPVHVLFISSSEKARLAKVLERVGTWSVLTVGEASGYSQAGVMINFFFEGNKTRFEINPERAQKANLRLSSQLLKLARITSSSL